MGALVLLCVDWEQSLTDALRRLLGWRVFAKAGPAVTLATVHWSLVEEQMAERGLNATPLERQEVFIWRELD